MYLPRQFQETDTAILHGLIRERSFGSLVVMTSEGLSVDHIPFILDDTSGPLGVLKGHVARANPLVKATLTDADAIAIFQGPDHYISPSWYPTKAETGEVVPTWNYVVVHAHGRPKLVDDEQWLRAQVTELTRHHEAARSASWKVSDAPESYVTKQLRAIVGIEISITRLSGKWKLGQNRPEADRQGTIDGLARETDTSAAALSAWMEKPR